VILLSGIHDTEMQWCYRHCGALLAPSTIEGFGLPVAEALLAGCPVVCSDIPAFRELGGDDCHYVPLDSNAEQDFGTAVCETLRERRRNPVKLPHLAASTIAEEYLQLYRSLASNPGHVRPAHAPRWISPQKHQNLW